MGLFSWFKKPVKNYSKEISSPDGRVCCKINLIAGELFYNVSKNGKAILYDSKLGIMPRGDTTIGSDMSVVRVVEKKFDATWETRLGEQRLIRNDYHEAALYLAEMSGKKRLLTIRIRVFDDSVAIRYEIPAQPEFSKITIADELTEFNIDQTCYAWHIPAYQPDRYEYNYSHSPVYELNYSVHTPLTIKTPSGYFLSIHEAALYNYGAMNIKNNHSHHLAADITPLSDGTRAHVELPFNTPWRVIEIADRAIDLITNRTILNLNDPPKQDFSWVKPIKFMGIWWAMFVGEWTWAPGERHGATTEHTIEYIDACNKLGIDGLLVEGWNDGWEGDWLQNGDSTNFLKPMDDFQIDTVTEYAKQHGVQLIGHHETVGYVDNYEKQLERAYQLYTKYGVHYIKPGYAGTRMTIGGRKEYHYSQAGVNHYQKALELAAKYQVMLDVHEPIKGTGIERTWPNLLTREGARGQEYEGGALSPSHACILPFTRLLAGGMDYTSGIFDVGNYSKRIASTLSRQLAYYVVIFSGMQMVADRPRFYLDEFPQAFQFIRDVPISWEITLPLLGEIGEYYVVARKERQGEDWYIGGITNEAARQVEIHLEFLDDAQYEAQIYRDGDNAHFRDNQLEIVIEKKLVSRADAIKIRIAAGGGFAIRLKRL